MDILKVFYDNADMRETVRAFFDQQLREVAVTKVFNKEDVSGMSDAKEVLDSVFVKLEEIYATKKDPIIESSR
jgi:hypothetical protein